LYVKVRELVWKNLVNQNARWNGEKKTVNCTRYVQKFILHVKDIMQLFI
jgi:hypothetical protein